METRVKVYAKINLSLKVTGKKGEFHSLDTVMASVDIFDAICLKTRPDKQVSVNFSSGLNGEKSNAYKAVKLLMEKSGCLGADIFIEQSIPSGGGLGGSSADSAGVIRAMQSAYGFSDEIALEVATHVGSDVAYMLKGGYARLNGTHAELEYFSANCDNEILLCGQGEVNTGECFKAFDNISKSQSSIDNDRLIELLKSNDFIEASSRFCNDLQIPAYTLCPTVKDIVSIMNDNGLIATMTGSGAFVFGVGESTALKKATSALKEKGYEPKRVKLVDHGIEIL